LKLETFKRTSKLPLRSQGKRIRP